jgi:hypothetical protein
MLAPRADRIDQQLRPQRGAPNADVDQMADGPEPAAADAAGKIEKPGVIGAVRRIAQRHMGGRTAFGGVHHRACGETGAPFEEARLGGEAGQRLHLHARHGELREIKADTVDGGGERLDPRGLFLEELGDRGLRLGGEPFERGPGVGLVRKHGGV